MFDDKIMVNIEDYNREDNSYILKLVGVLAHIMCYFNDIFDRSLDEDNLDSTTKALVDFKKAYINLFNYFFYNNYDKYYGDVEGFFKEFTNSYDIKMCNGNIEEDIEEVIKQSILLLDNDYIVDKVDSLDTKLAIKLEIIDNIIYQRDLLMDDINFYFGCSYPVEMISTIEEKFWKELPNINIKKHEKLYYGILKDYFEGMLEKDKLLSRILLLDSDLEGIDFSDKEIEFLSYKTIFNIISKSVNEKDFCKYMQKSMNLSLRKVIKTDIEIEEKVQKRML